MEIFFADDSVQSRCKRDGMGPVVGVGGILLDESHVRPLSAAIEKISAAFNVPPGEEFKWSPKSGSWIRDNLVEERGACYQQLLEAAAAHEAKAIVVCWDTGRTAENEAQAFERALDYLIERLNMHLEDRGAHAIIVADRPGGGRAQEDKFLEYSQRRLQKGTDYVMPEQLLMNVTTTSSHLVPHLQLADLVTGITTAVVAGVVKYAGPLFPYVQTLFIKNRPGGIAGTGLKISPDSQQRPDSLVNLYHWILKETLLHKGGGSHAYRLPAVGYAFEKDAFKAWP